MKLRNLLAGMGSILDLFPHRRELQLPPVKTDEEALASDWQAVGGDIRAGMKQLDNVIEEIAEEAELDTWNDDGGQ